LPLVSLSVLSVLGGAFGCQSLNTPLYFKGDSLTANTGDTPLASGGVTLRFRNPTNQEQSDLDAQTTSADYGGDVPWISAEKIHLELSYRVTNMSPTKGATFNVMVDGASQYAKYDSKTAAAALQQGNNDAPTY